VTAFRHTLRVSAAELGRSLPWIGHADPWAILVSEVMLQQTSVSRVVVPWRRFVDSFPTPTSCADAPLADVLRLWAGLGYHRRAKALHDAARVMRDRFDGAVPRDVGDLMSLPGVGEYTAHAVASFAFSKRVAVLDTNVGRVLARAIANRPLQRSEARAMARELLPRNGVAAFNQAMIDLGAKYCRKSPRCSECPVRGHCSWHLAGGDDPAPHSAGVSRPQPRFAGSDRQLRGLMLAELRRCSRTPSRLFASLNGTDESRLESILEGLVRDGLVQRRGRTIRLTGS
jgi:A/G-specific adenine glycosylase